MYYAKNKLNEFNKKFAVSEGSGITLANNERKDIIKENHSPGKEKFY